MHKLFSTLGAALLLAGCGAADNATTVPAQTAALPVAAPQTALPQAVPPASVFALAGALQPSPGSAVAQEVIARGKLMNTNLVRVRAGQAVQRHFHPTYEEMFYVLEGSAQLQLGQSVFPIGPGDFVYLPTGLAHGVTADPEHDLVLYTSTTGEGRTLLAPGEPGPATQVPQPPLQVAQVIPQVQARPGEVRVEKPLATGAVLGAGIIRVLSGRSFPRHYHQIHEESVLVLEGSARLNLAGQEYRVAPGDFFFMPSGTLHSLLTDPGADFVIYCVSSPPAANDTFIVGP